MSKYLIPDGWHHFRDNADFTYLVENGYIIRGWDDKGAYHPYLWDSKLHCYNQQPVRAYYRNLSKIRWN
mgnify:CR=1 FL=1